MKLTAKQDVEIGIVLSLIVLFLAWLWQDWIFVLFTAIVLVMVLIVPAIFRPLAFIWFGLARILGYITSKVLLMVLFYGLVLPVGIIRKWMGKDSLNLYRFNKEHHSILINKNHTFQSDDLKNPF